MLYFQGLEIRNKTTGPTLDEVILTIIVAIFRPREFRYISNDICNCYLSN